MCCLFFTGTAYVFFQPDRVFSLIKLSNTCFASAQLVTKRRLSHKGKNSCSAWCYIWRHRSSQRKQCFILNAWRHHFQIISIHVIADPACASKVHLGPALRQRSESTVKLQRQDVSWRICSTKHLLPAISSGREMPRRRGKPGRIEVIQDWFKWCHFLVNFGITDIIDIVTQPDSLASGTFWVEDDWSQKETVMERVGVWMCNRWDIRIERASMPVRLNPSTKQCSEFHKFHRQSREINVKSRPMPSHGAVDTSTGSTKALQFLLKNHVNWTFWTLQCNAHW